VELFQRVLPSVVTLYIKEQVWTESGAEEREGSGAGLDFPRAPRPDGGRRRRGAQEIVVKTQDGVLRPAEILYGEASADVALVRITGLSWRVTG
jgi:hypothetical protein